MDTAINEAETFPELEKVTEAKNISTACE
ncbi:hypothetical protein J9303_06945 [Bacillaceae bacterium Marseille-Q3522]|nr:hypothetical protein [Bacillaceae bacterium Marseille-Q3522]